MEDIILPRISFMARPEGNTLHLVHFALHPWSEGSGFLIGRPTAEEARAALERALREIAEAEAVAIDFRDVAAMTVSFAEGFFVPLLGQWSTGYHEEHPLVVFGANEEVLETLDAVLRLRHLAVLSVGDDGGGGAVLVGGEQGLGETAEAAYALDDGFGAADIADALGISLQAANNRLKELVRRGALRRAAGFAPSGGRQYVYHVPRPNGNAEGNGAGRGGRATGPARGARPTQAPTG